MEGRFRFLLDALNRLDESLVFRKSANMSETTLQPTPSDGLERMWQVVEALCNRLERARLESTAELQIRAIARLTEETESLLSGYMSNKDNWL